METEVCLVSIVDGNGWLNNASIRVPEFGGPTRHAEVHWEILITHTLIGHEVDVFIFDATMIPHDLVSGLRRRVVVRHHIFGRVKGEVWVDACSCQNRP